MVATSALETERRDETVFDDAALAGLTPHFRGELIRPGGTQYDDGAHVRERCVVDRILPLSDSHGLNEAADAAFGGSVCG